MAKLNSYVKLPEGKTPCSIIFPRFSYGFTIFYSFSGLHRVSFSETIYSHNQGLRGYASEQVAKNHGRTIWGPLTIAKESLGKYRFNGIYNWFMIAKLVNITTISRGFMAVIVL